MYFQTSFKNRELSYFLFQCKKSMLKLHGISLSFASEDCNSDGECMTHYRSGMRYISVAIKL